MFLEEESILFLEEESILLWLLLGGVGQQQNQKPTKIRSTINITIAVSFRMRRRPAGKTAKEGLFVVL